MKLAKYFWLLAAVLLTLPHVLVYAAGFDMLIQRRLFWIWSGSAVVLAFASWLLILVARRHKPVLKVGTAPAWSWPPSGDAAWQEVEAVAERIQEQDLPLDRPEVFWTVLREVLETVARHYHPDAKRAVLEVPVPHVLRIVELVARDFRGAFSERVPGARVLTLNDFLRIRWLAGVSRQFYFMYRLISAGFNPVSVLLREIRQAAIGGVTRASGRELKRSAIGFCVRRAGYYAIELYSGRLALDDLEVEDYQTRRSRKDVRQAERRDDQLAEEPLRVLVLGQVKSGKSSLINGLFGELRAAADSIPRTFRTEPYLLEREGIPQAIILDTAGYEATDDLATSFAGLRSEVLRADLLLVVCSALSAARGADRQLLDAIRAFHEEEPERIMPPMIVVVSRIDLLRPLGEWDPPYDIVRPHGAKAERIAAAVRAVAQDLAIGPEEVVVPVCLQEGRLYNVEESLVPAILQRLPDAQRAKCLRCLRTAGAEEYWRRLWRQSLRSGRVLLKDAMGG